MTKNPLTDNQRKIGFAWMHDVLASYGIISNCRPEGDGLFMQETNSVEEARIKGLAESVAKEIENRNFHNIDRALYDISEYPFNPDLDTPNSECTPRYADVTELAEYIADFCLTKKLYWDDARRLKNDAVVESFKLSRLGRMLEIYGCFVSQITKADTLSLPDEPFTEVDKLVQVLDLSLRNAKRRTDGRNKLGTAVYYSVSHIALTGPATTGKVAAISEWAENNGLNLFILDATKNSIRSDLFGYAAGDYDDPNYFEFKYSGALDALDKPNSVLLIPNLSDQFDSSLRHFLCKLAVEGWVVGNDENNRKYFPNLLLTITCVRPTNPNDPFDTRLDYYDWCKFTNHSDV